MSECLFCRIATGELPATIVGQTEGAVAFQDINPAAPTHVLVIPRAHIASAADLGPEHAGLLDELFSLANEVAAGLDKGFRIVTNIGRDGGQTVSHLHFHVLGGRGLGWPPG